MSERSESGQTLPILSVVVLLAGLAVIGVGRLGRIADARARAQTAADAGALACVLHGEDAASDLIRTNGAQVVSGEVVGAQCRVIAEVEGEQAVARARRE